MKNGNVLLTVGNGMMGDDGAGALLAQMLLEQPCAQWVVVHGGSAPENLLHRVRDLSPRHVMVVDACDMDLPPGSVRVIPEDALQSPFFFSTHTLPLSYLVDALRQFSPQVTFLGIQPQEIAFGYPLSTAVRQAVAQIAQDLHSDRQFWRDYEVVVVNLKGGRYDHS